jgi:hypothetical protein
MALKTPRAIRPSPIEEAGGGHKKKSAAKKASPPRLCQEVSPHKQPADLSVGCFLGTAYSGQLSRFAVLKLDCKPPSCEKTDEATELCGVLTTLNFSDLGRRAAPPPPPRATTLSRAHARTRPRRTPGRHPRPHPTRSAAALCPRPRRPVGGRIGPCGHAALCLVGCSCVWCGRAEVCGDRVRAVVYWAINSYLTCPQ